MSEKENSPPVDRAPALINEDAPVGPSAIQPIGQAANQAARARAFAAYQERKAPNTLRRQKADLARLADFLSQAGQPPGDLFADPEAWRGITWGLVQAFVRWQLHGGYSVASVNVRLSTIKTYAKLAAQAGSLTPQEYALIRTVEGYRRKEARRLDDQRTEADVPTRKGAKKAAAVPINDDQAQQLKHGHVDDPQGRRDRLLMCLLIDHGLRCGEVAALQVAHLDLDYQPPCLHFFRPKVDLEQRHRLSPDTLAAARAYLAQDALASGPLLRASRKGGALGKAGLSERAITARVKALGERLGIAGLSAHDLRHHWATTAARNGTPIDRLQDAGGWSSPAMPLHYVKAAEIANEGVILKKEK